MSSQSPKQRVIDKDIKEAFKLFDLDPQTASFANVHKRFRTLSFEFHSDKNLDDPNRAEFMFKRINGAFESLREYFGKLIQFPLRAPFTGRQLGGRFNRQQAGRLKFLSLPAYTDKNRTR